MLALRLARIVLLGIVVAIVLIGFSSAQADLIILKDGFVIRGKVQREGKMEVDRATETPTLEWIPQGFFYLDDGVRRVIFNPRLVSHVEPKKIDTSNFVKFDKFIRYVSPRPAPPILEVLETTDWDDKWNRQVRFRSLKNDNGQARSVTFRFNQHLQMLTPEFAFGDSFDTAYPWQAHYLTRELGPKMVRELLAVHKDFRDDPKLSEDERVARRFKWYHFFVEAEWLSEAASELDRIEKDYPKARDRIAEARKNLASLLGLQLYDDLKRAHEAGQYQWVQEHFRKLPESGLPEKMLAEMRALQGEYEAATANLKLAQRYLAELPAQLDAQDADTTKALTEAARTIAGEVHLDHILKSKSELRGEKEEQQVGRLDTFLAQAQQAERETKQSGKSETRPAELLALATTGWLLGGRSAEKRPEFARQLWLARQFILQYERTVGVEKRRQLLEKYQQEQTQKNPAISVEEFAQLVPMLPPLEPARELTGETEFTADASRGSRSVKYLVKLPPGYHPGRPWPVLVSLHQGGESLQAALRRWELQGGRNGYILVAPEWSANADGAYEHTVAEHLAVLDMLRDLRRKFRVDSDRIFVTGTGIGGTLAYEIGLAHPDQFAGMLPICGLPGGWCDRYLRNAHYLPVYAVCGDFCGDIHKENRRVFKDWIAKNYPAMYVEYKGRGLEAYSAEADFAFDWMNRKVRANPVSQVGVPGEEFRTMREEDNRFYWLSTEKIQKGNLMPTRWSSRVIAASMWAQVIGTNRIAVSTYGLKQVSVWFSRGMKVDINKPVIITVNNALKWQTKVKADLSILLEDLYERGDQQRLYVARADMEL